MKKSDIDLYETAPESETPEDLESVGTLDSIDLSKHEMRPFQVRQGTLTIAQFVPKDDSDGKTYFTSVPARKVTELDEFDFAEGFAPTAPELDEQAIAAGTASKGSAPNAAGFNAETAPDVAEGTAVGTSGTKAASSTTSGTKTSTLKSSKK